MRPPLRVAIGAVLGVAILTGSAVAGLGPFPAVPSDETPGWDGDGHKLLVNQTVSVGEDLTAHVAAATPTEDGGRIVVGFHRFSLRAFTDDRVATAWRIGPDGDLVWSVDLARNESFARDIVSTGDGFAVAGVVRGEVFVVTLTADGTVSDRLLVERDGSQRIGGMAATRDGGVVLVGFELEHPPEAPYSQFDADVKSGSGWVIRTDGEGRLAWQRQIHAVPRDVIADGDGFLAVGEVSRDEKWNATVRPWVQRFTADQSVEWTRVWPVNNSKLTTVAPAEDGYVFGGRFLRFDAEARGYLYTAAVFGANESAGYRWTRVLTATGRGTVTDAAIRPDGSVALAATVDADQATNLAILTADTTGVSGAAVLGGPRFDSARAIWATPAETLQVIGDVEQDTPAEPRHILLLEMQLTGTATPLLPPEEVAATRGDVTLSPTTTRPDVLYGETGTESTESETPTVTEAPIIRDPEDSGRHYVGMLLYAVPFLTVAALVVAVRRRLR